jgi:hypothetical protein
MKWAVAAIDSRQVHFALTRLLTAGLVLLKPNFA